MVQAAQKLVREHKPDRFGQLPGTPRKISHLAVALDDPKHSMSPAKGLPRLFVINGYAHFACVFDRLA
jgi:hypothetical protein